MPHEEKKETKPKRKKITVKAAKPKKKSAALAKGEEKKSSASRISVVDTTPDVANIPVLRARLRPRVFRSVPLRIDVDALFIGTARFAGIFFVVVGALFALINIQNLNGYHAGLEAGQQLAQVTGEYCDPALPEYDPLLCEESSHGGESTVTDPCDSSSNAYDPNGCIDSNPFYEPAVFIELHERTPVENSIDVSVRIPDFGTEIDEVSILVDDVLVGSANTGDFVIWNYTVHTDQYEAGLHRLATKVYMLHGYTYVSEHIYFEVDMLPEDTSNEGEPIPPEDENANDEEGSIDETEIANPDDNEVSTEEGDAEDPLTVDPESETNYDEVLKPEALIDVRSASPLSGLVEVVVNTREADFIELYVVPRYGNQEHFLGLGSRTDQGEWLMRWDTSNKPNGEYKLFVRIKNAYGLYDSEPQPVSVYNELAFTGDKETESAADVRELKETVEPIIKEVEEENVLVDKEGNSDESKIREEDQIIQEAYDRLFEKFEGDIDEEMARFRSTLRSGDEDAVLNARKRIDDLRDRIAESLLAEDFNEVLLAELRIRLEETVARIEQTTEQSESFVKERVGEAITKDTDNDGITDYDEVNIYETDPLVADTDGDGFVDGAEILNGYNPKNDTPETLVAYESPKEFGVLREDYLVVEDIATDEDVRGRSTAIISGRGLPNSFVTLYIFSTPIVVTVKTNDDGSWSYRFDKELEDGTHEVYVGITDNAGKIIAKSSPLPFVKTAEAFSPVSASTENTPLVSQTETEDSLLTDSLMLIILSIAVVALGLVLMLLGLHMQARPKRATSTLEPSAI